MGYISASVTQPTLVQSLSELSVKKINCGDNYSAVITSEGKLLVAGEVSGGKLGLGKAHSSGYILCF
jgi:alpha-tubulin suppressor-like RCC1 family protein